MVEVPTRIRLLLSEQKYDISRSDPKVAQAEMLTLGINQESEIYAFFSEFCATTILSQASYETLCDISEPTPQITVGTEFIHDVWKLSKEYICLTSLEGEGGFLYSTSNGAVFDFSLEGREEFLKSPLPRWQSFFEFLEWYLAPSDEKC